MDIVCYRRSFFDKKEGDIGDVTVISKVLKGVRPE